MNGIRGMANEEQNDNLNTTDLLKQAASLERVHNKIENNPTLRSCIYNASADGDTLVVFCNQNQKIPFVKQTLEHHWLGDIEVYCPSDLMVGSFTNLSN